MSIIRKLDKQAMAEEHGFSSMEELLRTMGGQAGEWSGDALANLLGVDRATIYRWMKKYEIPCNKAYVHPRKNKGVSLGWMILDDGKKVAILDIVQYVADIRYIGYEIARIGKLLRKKQERLDKNWKRRNFRIQRKRCLLRGHNLELSYEIWEGADVVA